MLSTSPGRTLAAIPRSANQTSPRLGCGTRILLGFVAAEQFRRHFIERRVRHGPARGAAAQNLRHQLALLGRGKGFKGLQQVEYCFGHGMSPVYLNWMISPARFAHNRFAQCDNDPPPINSIPAALV